MKIGEKTWLALCVLGMVNAAQGQTIGAMPGIGDFGLPPKNAQAEQKAKAAEQKLSAERKARENADKRAAEAERKHAEAEKRALELERKQAEAEQPTAAKQVVAVEGRKAGEVFKDCAECPEMVVIPAGSFEMGSNSGEMIEKPVHAVRIARPFALAKTEVTIGQWKTVMGKPPIFLFLDECNDCSVEYVSWSQAQEYVKRLSAKTGQAYRLPSEAEWEYACHAGGTHSYCGSNDVDRVAWYDKNSNRKTQPVGQKQANAFGLYDMSGNVWEFTGDCTNNSYEVEVAPSDGNAWPNRSCEGSMLRGGSRLYAAKDARAAVRLWAPSTREEYASVGFRPARVLP